MKNKIIVQCGLKIKDEYWFVAGNTNGLFRKNLLTKKIDFVDFFPEEGKLAFRLYSDMKLVDDKLIFAPCHTKTFAIYHLKERKFSTITIENVDEERYNRYLRLVAYQDSVYYIPYLASSFVKYGVRDESIKVLDEWNEICNKYSDSAMKNFIIEAVCVNNKNIYMFTSRNNRAVVLDMETDQFEIKELNISAEEYIVNVYLHDQNIWIVTDKNKIYRWNIVNDEQDLFIDLNKCTGFSGFDSHYIYATDRYIYLVNTYDKNIRMFDFLSNEALVIDMNECVEDKKDDNLGLYYYFDIHCANDKLYLQSFYDGIYITIDGKKVVDTSEKIYIPEEYWENFYNETIFESHLVNLGMSIPEWACHGWKPHISLEDKNIQQNNVGKEIYDEVMRDNL